MNDDIHNTQILEYLNSLSAAIKDNRIEMETSSLKSINPYMETSSLFGDQRKYMHYPNPDTDFHDFNQRAPPPYFPKEDLKEDSKEDSLEIKNNDNGVKSKRKLNKRQAKCDKKP